MNAVHVNIVSQKDTKLLFRADVCDRIWHSTEKSRTISHTFLSQPNSIRYGAVHRSA